ncbi:hypothetical protein DFQ04_3070 [Algoriphagus boseongensis]|uniref:YozE SAM-like protein n=1 Tax=Algoriphagus boseongensis TaxID=1442587 RepID=A0A4R6T5D6_9BACT|nr:hypothetical protein [Algoriphagus boseongensis]TDQ15184.1 hypothetical protein DFQ04_3070 [Algoriphagus boseongensis]
MKLIEFIIINSQKEESPLGDFCSDILRDPDFPFDSKMADQFQYLKSVALLNGLSEQYEILKSEYEYYIQDLDYERNHGINSKPDDSIRFKSGAWADLKSDFQFQSVLFVKGSKEYYKAYLIDDFQKKALFLEFNSPMQNPQPRIFEFMKAELLPKGELHSTESALVIFKMLRDSPLILNKFLIEKAIDLLLP